ALGAQLLDRRLELLRTAAVDGQRVALGAEHVGQGVADAGRGSGDDGGAVGHFRVSSRWSGGFAHQTTYRLGSMRRLLPVLVVLAALAVVGCGSGGDDAEPPPTPQPSARAEDFPAAKGKTLMTLREGLPKGP